MGVRMLSSTVPTVAQLLLPSFAMAPTRVRPLSAAPFLAVTALFISAGAARAQVEPGKESPPQPAAVARPAAAVVRAPGQPPAPGTPTTSQPRAPIAATHEDKPTATAVRTDAAITIDGTPDEAAWFTAPAVTDFWQVSPDEGAPVSEHTEVRFLYDDEAIYVGGWFWDSDGRIVRRLSRRDTGINDVDLFAFHFDAFHSHRSSYRFVVSSAGAIRDLAAGAGQGLTSGDQSFNPVWDYNVTTTEQGWFVEARIPFSQLRFSQADEQVWGLQLERKIRPQIEETVFAYTQSTDPPGQHNFGHLVGIRGIKPGAKLELLPYVSGSAEYLDIPQSSDVTFANPFRSGSDYFVNVGGDLKYKLTSNLTLDGTINPDFGQVELDPAVINLTAFETRFAERRPFFVEGAEIFEFGESGNQLFYSRRVGRAPRGNAPSAAVYDESPPTTTILGAAKVSGKTADGWGLALVNAVTQREFTTWRDTLDAEHETEIEPLTNYFTGRIRRDMRGGLSHVGALATAVHRSLAGSPLESSTHATAYTAGVDFSHDFANRAWHVAGSFSPSRVTGTTSALIGTQRLSSRYFQRPDADYLEVDSSATSLTGYTAEASLAKQRGLWRFSTALSAISPGYEINDLGFGTNADRVQLRGSFGYDQTRPGSVFRSWNASVAPDFAWNYGGDRIGVSTRLSGRVQLMNFHSYSANLNLWPERLNQRLTRGGPMARDPQGYSASVGWNTPGQNRRSYNLGLDWGGDDSGAWQWSASAGVNFRIGDKLDVRTGTSFERGLGTAQYITSVADPTATSTYGRRYVFGEILQNTVSMDARINITLSPRVTIEIYAQPLVSSGDYRALKELAAPRTFDFNTFGVDAGTISETNGGRGFRVDPDGAGPANGFNLTNRDFNVRELRSNAVFRWEWRPGSTLFLVWQQTRSGEFVGSDPDSPLDRVGNFEFGRDAGDLFNLHPDNVLMIKASYWLNP
jgi:hypothetical protein